MGDDLPSIPKLPIRDLPKPQKRKGFTARQVAAVFIKCEGRCTKCHEKVKLDGYHIDHIQRHDALGAHELENWQLLCLPCHGVKTRVDNREAKKGRRIRGELKPKRSRPVPQRVDPSAQRKLLSREDDRESRSPDLAANGWGRLRGRGFDKTKTRGFNGKVRERT